MRPNNNRAGGGQYYNRNAAPKPNSNAETILGKTIRINDQIKSQELRVVDQNGEMLGVISLEKALQLASDAQLDLIEVSPNAEPPVCKIANFSKMRYELQKKAADAKKKQKVVETKEIKMTINIGKNDFDVKIKHVQKFIEHGDKVKISVRMKGREITHLDLAKEMMQNILAQTENFAKPEFTPKLKGMQIIAILVKK